MVYEVLIALILFSCQENQNGKQTKNGNRAEQSAMIKYSALNKGPAVAKNDVEPEPMENLLKMKWIAIVETPKEDSNLPIAPPMVKNGLVFPNTVATHVFDASTGRKLYYRNSETKKIIKSQLKDSLLIFQETDLLRIQNIYTGEIFRMYRQDFFQRQNESPRFLNNPFILTAEEDVLKMVNIDDNKTIMERQFNSRLIGNYIVMDNFIFFADLEYMYFMDFNGVITDSLSLGEMDCKPILDEETIYAFIDKLGLVAIDTKSRQVKWTYKNDWFDALLLVEGDTLYANHGCISAFGKKKGELYWDMDCESNEVFFSNQLVYFNEQFVGFLEGFSNIPRIGAVKSNGKINHFKWSNTEVFNINGEYNPGPVDPEEDRRMGPVMMLSDIYDNMIFGQYNNVVVGFEILKVKN